MTRLSTLLNTARRQAGRPSLRTIADTAGVSHTTVADTLNGARTPSWPILAKIANALAIDPEEAKKLWDDEIEAGLRTPRRMDGPPAPPARVYLMCAICLYLPGDEREDAVTVIEGYAVCGDHLGYVTQGTRWYRILAAAKAGNGYIDESGEF